MMQLIGCSAMQHRAIPRNWCRKLESETVQVQDNRARLKQWLESGEIRLQPLTFPQRELWEASPVPVADASNNICATIQLRGFLTRPGCEAGLRKGGDRQGG